ALGRRLEPRGAPDLEAKVGVAAGSQLDGSRGRIDPDEVGGAAATREVRRVGAVAATHVDQRASGEGDERERRIGQPIVGEPARERRARRVAVPVVALDAGAAALRVDAAGDAQVDWTASDGSRHTLLVERSGVIRYGGTLAGGDVSHAIPAGALPWVVVVRETPDGSFYALQSWQRLDNGPVELRFSRWQGDPTKLTLRAVCCRW